MVFFTPLADNLAATGGAFLIIYHIFDSTKMCSPKNWKLTPSKEKGIHAKFEVDGYFAGFSEKDPFTNSKRKEAFIHFLMTSKSPLFKPKFKKIETQQSLGKVLVEVGAKIPFHPFYFRQMHTAHIPDELKKLSRFQKVRIKGVVLTGFGMLSDEFNSKNSTAWGNDNCCPLVSIEQVDLI